MRVVEPRQPEPHGHHLITRWNYNPALHGHRLCIEFKSAEVYRKHHVRWRTFANSLWRVVCKHSSLTFSDIPVDLGDGEVETIPADVFRFARRPGQPHDLLPNLHLLRPRPRLPQPIGWQEKTDSLYFRGAATGSRDYEQSIRIAACRAARGIPETNCRLTRFPEVSDAFAERARTEGLAGREDPLAEMNHHRFLLDVDGNTSSWDRFLLIGWFGGVPVRFEPAWEECWHTSIREDVHFVTATRTTLPDVLNSLRADPSRAQTIAAAASAVARQLLSSPNVQRMLEESWVTRIDRLRLVPQATLSEWP